MSQDDLWDRSVMLEDIHLAIELTKAKHVNCHLIAYLQHLRQSQRPLVFTVFGEKDHVEYERFQVVIRQSLNNASMVISPNGMVSETAHMYFPATNGSAARIAQALLKGVKVVQNCAVDNIGRDYRDVMTGYIENSEVDWYARIFPEPVFLGAPGKVVLGLGATINPRAIILNQGIDGAGGLVRIGRATHIGADVLLNLGPTDFTVGNFSMISANFSAHGMRHSLTHVSNFSIKKGPFAFFGSPFDFAKSITIGNDVWIGEGVTCLPGVDIPDGCVVGAGSVVTKGLEPYAVYAGNPARLLRYRFDEEKISLLRETAWWNFAYLHLRAIQHVFKQKVSDLTVDGLRDLLELAREECS